MNTVEVTGGIFLNKSAFNQTVEVVLHDRLLELSAKYNEIKYKLQRNVNSAVAKIQDAYCAQRVGGLGVKRSSTWELQ